MQTLNAGIREAKIHLSKLLKYVQNGNEVILTDRGRAVGKIVPIRTNEFSLEERIQRLEDQGVIKPPPKNYRQKFPQPIPVSDNIAQRFLSEERDGRK